MIGLAPGRSRSIDRAAAAATPIVIALALHQSTRVGLRVEHLVGLAAGGLLLAMMVRRPTLTAPVLLVLLPVQTVVFALGYANGVGVGVLRPLAGLKELAILALLVRGERDRRRAGRPLDALDRACLGYLAVAVTYFLLGRFLVEAPTLTGGARLAGLREDVLFVVVLYGARNLAWSSTELRRVLRWLGVGVAVTLAFAVWHQVDADGFTRWVFDSAGIVGYLHDVLGLDAAGVTRTLHHFQEADPRLMGSFLTPISLADYLLLPFALLLAATVRGRLGGLGAAGVAGLAFLVIETRTRVDTVSMAVMVLVVLAMRSAARADRRVASAVVAALVAVVVVPAVLVPSVFGKEGADASTEGHRSEWVTSFSDFVERPQGGGLGSTTASVRFSGVDRSNGNSYLLMGNELGVAGLAAFAAVLVLTARALARRMRSEATPTWVTAAALFAVGLAVAGTTHHVLENLAVSWTMWLLLALACRHRGAEEEPSSPR